MRIGILGTGMIVQSLMQTIKKLNFSYIAVLGTRKSEEKARSLCEEHGLDAYFVDYDQLLAQGVDVVYVALPNHLHAHFAEKALLHDRHVIIEKPVTADAAQLRKLMRIADERNKMIFEAMTIHYLPAFASIRENLAQAGTLKIASLNYSQYSSRYDAFTKGQVLPVFDPKKAGGALMDLNIYNIHAAAGLFGKPKKVTYEANIEREIDTSGVLTLDYGTFKVSAIAAKDCQAPAQCTIQGTKGCFVIPKPVSQMDGYDLLLNHGEVKSYRQEAPKHRLYYEFMEFQRMIQEKDWAKQREMLQISLIASEILDEARKQNGIFMDFTDY